MRDLSFISLLVLFSLFFGFRVYSQDIYETSDRNEFDFRLSSYKDSLYLYIRDSVYLSRIDYSGYKEYDLSSFITAYKMFGKSYSKDFVQRGIHPVRYWVLEKLVQIGSCTCQGYRREFIDFLVLHPKPTQLVRFNDVSLDKKVKKEKVKVRKSNFFVTIPIKEFKGFDLGDVDDSDLIDVSLVGNVRSDDLLLLGLDEFIYFTSKGYPTYDKVKKSWVLVADGYINKYDWK
jgi:hypothetical protein